ncbi:hypothetical protein CDCA_CDCA09G2828 [Cyanidium caldarium]|uniref:GOLD domain-containing protein n=1 Tax=Cyanidium caldarium TaxID=2771 RepID=A0AAV9IWX7_CYACA|nr:hypothetical protein CDCA_CDCA09G2828 [Cyanidium caldarium]
MIPFASLQRLLIFLFLVLLLGRAPSATHALTLSLPPHEPQCFTESALVSQSLVGSYASGGDEAVAQDISVTVRAPSGAVVLQAQGAERQFEVAVKEDGEYEVCFQSRRSTPLSLLAQLGVRGVPTLVGVEGNEAAALQGAAQRQQVQRLERQAAQLFGTLQLLRWEQNAARWQSLWQVEHLKRAMRRMSVSALLKLGMVTAIAAGNVWLVRSYFPPLTAVKAYREV